LTDEQKIICELREENLILKQQLDYLKRQIYGSKSEKLDHPELFVEEPPGKPEASSEEDQGPEEEPKSTDSKKPKKRHPIRTQRLPKHLPVRTQIITPSDVLLNPEKWRLLSTDQRDQLEKEPGYFYINRRIYENYVPVEETHEKAVLSAPAPPTIIEKGYWGESLLSEIICNRYLYHLPYYRQEQLYTARYGVKLSRKTMSDTVCKVADQLKILLPLMKENALESRYIRADETTVRYLDKDAPGGSSTGYFWVYKGLNGDVLFDWQTSREHHHFANWIGEDFEGTIGSDGYEAYHKHCRKLENKGRKVKRASCYAHVRRKYEQALEQKPELAKWFLKIFGKLYQIEALLRENNATKAQKESYRLNHSLPQLKLLEKAIKHLLQSPKIPPKSRLGQALRYSLGQWSGMATYIAHGEVEIDNNGVERDIRPSAVGKKNWLFVGSPDAGEQSAIIYSLLISARHHGVDPEAYLRDLLKRLPGSSTDPTTLSHLLPANWAEASKAKQKNQSAA